jgi:hypothetical protein
VLVISRSSTYTAMVVWWPDWSLFRMHISYGFGVNPIEPRKELDSLYHRRADSIHP